jgi:hypothetical protein
MSFMPSCRDIAEHSSGYLDKNLPFWTRMGIRLHLFMCVNCRRYLQHMRLTIATLARLHDTKPPDPATVNTIVQKLRQEAPKHTHHH